MRSAVSLLIALGTLILHAQTPALEVASIKPSQTTGKPMMSAAKGGRINATNVTLKYLILWAWDLRPYQVSGGPPWLDSAAFDIIATPEHPMDPSPDNIEIGRQMIRSLLADRFQLAVRLEQKELPRYALIHASNGPALKTVEKWQNPTDMRVHAGGPGHLTGEKVTISLLTGILSDITGRAVADKTGLTGYYDFNLDWTPDDVPPDPASPSIFTALQEQLGLKLESEKGPVRVLTIYQAEKPSKN
jgi:uncharacterized protein (TIGR03435 family)